MSTGFAAELPESLSREFLLEHRVCPVGRHADGRVIVAAAEDAPIGAIDELALAFGVPVFAEPTARDEVERQIERLTAIADNSREPDIQPAAGPDDEDIRNLANEAPVVRYLNLLLRDAVDARASDIHLEATRDRLRVRLRVDGVLVNAESPPRDLRAAVISRIKLLSDLDIAERRRPQDGRLRVRLDSREMDVRVATAPTSFGESVVLRLLDRGGRPVSLGELGMSSSVQGEVRSAVARPHGLLLVTGPTGSGKTSTLYAALQLRRAEQEKLVTVEDPVEYQLPGVTQIPVHRASGVTFAAALRAILRQDPDVIMVGEMRDTETAEVAVQAALTGHLVLATLHTNDAVSAIPRLVDLGIPPFLVAATLAGVLAQRLVRCVCPECGAKSAADECKYCLGTGYRGRTGVFQWVGASDELLAAIAQGSDIRALNAIVERHGTRTLLAEGEAVAATGLTTHEEVLRVFRS